ncbi:MAG: ribonuclease J [Oscillospiraceae bacterium]|nr:ribonuclease J [Oscillospiraceae bacterium]
MIPLGGLGEIGKNVTVLEYENDIIIIDCGMGFPDENMLGIDIVLADLTYLKNNRDKIRGLFITHGHEDHIGGTPYLLKEINVPIYATKFTLGLIERKLNEHRLDKIAQTKVVKAGTTIRAGKFSVEFVRNNHSIPDSCSLAIKTPVGTIFHTGDFRLDTHPVSGDMMDITRIAELGKEGVLALMSDSTNVERPGYSRNETSLDYIIDDIFSDKTRRIIVTTFASNVHRVQQFIDAAVKNDRKIAICGRSMEDIIQVAMDLGYATVPKNSLISIDEIKKYPPERLLIMTTGSQGQPMSALARMAYSEHRKVQINSNDLIIFSSSPIPGNESMISKVINELFRKGAKVVYDDVHVSGHAYAEELRLILKLTKPKYFIPVHGEYRHLKKHAEIGKETGVRPNNIFVLDTGNVLELDGSEGKVANSVQSGVVYVDGLGVGDIGNIVLRERKTLSQDGIIIAILPISHGQMLSKPEILSRGFVYIREAGDLMDELNGVVTKVIKELLADGKTPDWNTIKSKIRDSLGDFVFKKTKRKPIILPIIIEV